MDEFYSRKITINKEQNKNRLDLALAKLTGFSRSQIKILLNNRKVTKNHIIIKDSSYKVKTDEKYLLSLLITKDKKFEPEDIPLDIVFEDKDIIIINKVSGMVTHPGPGNNSGTLVNALLNYSKNNLSNINNTNRPGIVHRLDKETSGLMVIAKNNESHAKLSEQFKSHSISRKYTALVWGVPNNQSIEGYIERHHTNRKKMSLNKNEKGRYSYTKIKLLQSFEIASLIECSLKTGRTHQIRVHLTSINNPIIGDKVYGKNKVLNFGKNKNTFNKFLILRNFSRQALHAHHLGFIHPKSNKYIEFNNAPSKDIQNLLNLILKY